MNDQRILQLQRVRTAPGFLAALDQSGGSTPKALKLYGVPESAYSNDEEMFDLIHQMRSRIVTSPSFGGDRILGAILFESTMDRQIGGRAAADYLWSEKNVVPFLKVDKGLSEATDDVQLMKPMPDLDELLEKANRSGIFGTKMRSVISLANPSGIDALVQQQFDVAKSILAAGLVPIIEPEVDIHSSQKAEAEAILLDAIRGQLDTLADDQRIMLKLTLPDVADFYRELVDHPNVARVVALSGGYDRESANARLASNHGVIASFSRALTEGLSVEMSEDDFDAALDQAIASIFSASTT